MALKSVTQEGVHRFALHCDSCDRPIENATQGNSVWQGAEGTQAAYTVHKGDCQRALAATLGINANALASDELAYLPTRLETVMGIDPAQARQGAAFLDRLRAIPSTRL